MSVAFFLFFSSLLAAVPYHLVDSTKTAFHAVSFRRVLSSCVADNSRVLRTCIGRTLRIADETQRVVQSSVANMVATLRTVSNSVAERVQRFQKRASRHFPSPFSKNRLGGRQGGNPPKSKGCVTDRVASLPERMRSSVGPPSPFLMQPPTPSPRSPVPYLGPTCRLSVAASAGWRKEAISKERPAFLPPVDSLLGFLSPRRGKTSCPSLRGKCSSSLSLLGGPLSPPLA